MAYLTSMWLPKAPASVIRSTRSMPQMVHQQPGAGVERGLGELDRAHVGLQDAEFRLARVQQVGEGPAIGLDPGAAGSERAIDDAVAPEDAGEEHLGQGLDDAGAADAGDAGPAGRLGEARVVRPEVGADHLEARLERQRDRSAPARSRPAPPAGRRRSARPRTPGPVGRGGGEQPMPVAEHDLGVGADVDDQRHLVGQMRRLGQEHARRCRRRRGRRCRAGRRRGRWGARRADRARSPRA